MKILVPEFGFSAGTETVLLKVLPRWAEGRYEVVLAAPAFPIKRFNHRKLDARIGRIEWGSSNGGWRRGMRRLESKNQSQFLRKMGLRDQARRSGATHVFVPWVVNEPVVDFGLPTGVMVMDLAWRHDPTGWFDQSVEKLDETLRNWICSAEIAFPVSDSTAIEVKSVFSGIGEKLCVMLRGAEPRIQRQQEPQNKCAVFLTPASMTPNKGHLALLTAAIQLWKEGLDFTLIWMGSRSREVVTSEQIAAEELSELQVLYRKNKLLISGRLDARGFVSYDELEHLYEKADRVISPSTYEGFGLPILEALARGVRVIFSDIATFTEQAKRYDMEPMVSWVRLGESGALMEAIRTVWGEIKNATKGVRKTAVKFRPEIWDWSAAAELYANTLRGVMRILTVKNHYQLGGAETVARQLHEGALKAGHDARVFRKNDGRILSENLRTSGRWMGRALNLVEQ